ncbi:hypothetical protein D3C72_2452350 [compost metagenome]
MGQVEQVSSPQTGFNRGGEPVLQSVPGLRPGVAEQGIQDMRRAPPLQVIELVIDSDAKPAEFKRTLHITETGQQHGITYKG